MICEAVNREAMYGFLMRMKDPQSGGFRMHDIGEVDIRSTYCALSVAAILNLLTPELVKGTMDYIAR
mgnify:CR=1 FL=1